MGEIAEAMLNGELCEACGEYIGDGDGIPGYCSPQCARDRGADWWLEANGYQDAKPTKVEDQRPPKRFKCNVCGKGFRYDYALEQHREATGHKE